MQPLIPFFQASTIDVLGLFTIQVFGTLLVTGVALGSYLTLRAVHRQGLSSDEMVGFFPWLYCGLFAGGILGQFLFYQVPVSATQPTGYLRLNWGVSSMGGFALASSFAVLYFKSHVRRWAYGDALVEGTAAGLLIARIGCFAVHDHPGKPTHFWLGVHGICPGGPASMACHDLGLYEAGLALIVLGTFSLLRRVPRRDGSLVVAFCLVYGGGRFMLEWLRHPAIDPRVLGLTPAQYGCLCIMVLGIWLHYRQRQTALSHDVSAG